MCSRVNYLGTLYVNEICSGPWLFLTTLCHFYQISCEESFFCHWQLLSTISMLTEQCKWIVMVNSCSLLCSLNSPALWNLLEMKIFNKISHLNLLLIWIHGTNYVERLRDEKGLYQTICLSQGFYEKTKQADPLSRVILRRLDHIYSKVCVYFFIAFWADSNATAVLSLMP